MKVVDLIGNPIEVNDTVVIDLAHVVGVIQKVETGELLSATGQQAPPHVIIQIQATTALPIQAPAGSPVGQVPGLVKVQSPEAGK